MIFDIIKPCGPDTNKLRTGITTLETTRRIDDHGSAKLRGVQGVKARRSVYRKEII